MNVLKYFVIFFVAFIIADVDCFPAKNRQEKSALRHKKKEPEKHLQTELKRPKNVLKRPKRHIPPELIARHHETLRCLRQYLRNQGLGTYQPYTLPIIRNPIRYQPSYVRIPNHRPLNNFKHDGKIYVSFTDKNGGKKIHNQILKTNVHPPVANFKQPAGLGIHLEAEIKRKGEEGILVDSGSTRIENLTRVEGENRGKTTPGFHSFNATTTAVKNDYEVHEAVMEEDTWKGNHLTERETGTTEEYEVVEQDVSVGKNIENGLMEEATSEKSLPDKKGKEEEFVTEAWESKKIQEDEDFLKEDVNKDELPEPIDLLRIKDKESVTEAPKKEEIATRKLEEFGEATVKQIQARDTTEPLLRRLESEATTSLPEEGRYVGIEATELGRDFEATTISEARSFTELERHLEATTIADARIFETNDEITSADARNAEPTTSEARLLETNDEVTSADFRNLEATTSEARSLETNDEVTSADFRNLEATTSEARLLKTNDEVTSADFRNLEATTSEARSLETNDEVAPAGSTELIRNLEATTSEARFLEIVNEVASDDPMELEATTSEARFLETDDDVATADHTEIGRNMEATTSETRFLETDIHADEEVTSRNLEDATTPEARFLETEFHNDEEQTRNLEGTTPEVRFLETELDHDDEVTSRNLEAPTTPEARFLDFESTARDYQETTISFDDELKQERKLHHDPYLESNDIDQIYPEKTEASDISYDEERTNSVGTYKPTPMEINQILHIDQNPKNLTSLSQTIEASTEKRRSDILITDEYSEDRETVPARTNLQNLTIFDDATNATTYTEPPDNFSPESLIQLLPVIIHDLRNKSVSVEDMKVLTEVFGPIWPYITQLSQDPNINMTQLLNIKNEEDLQNIINLYGRLKEQNEDLDFAETESFSYSTIPSESSLYDYVDDTQEIAYDPPDEEIIEEEKETETETETDFHPRSADFSNFGEFQNDFNGFESEDIPPETFAEQEYEVAEDNSDGFYETNPSVIELFHTAQAHDAIKNVRLPSSQPQFPESPFSGSDNFYL